MSNGVVLLSERDWQTLGQLPTDEFVRPMDIGGTDSSRHSHTLQKLARYGFAEQKRHYRGVSGGHWRYRRVDILTQSLALVRILAGYACAGVDQEADDPSLCGKCGVCDANTFLDRWSLR